MKNEESLYTDEEIEEEVKKQLDEIIMLVRYNQDYHSGLVRFAEGRLATPIPFIPTLTIRKESMELSWKDELWLLICEITKEYSSYFKRLPASLQFLAFAIGMASVTGGVSVGFSKAENAITGAVRTYVDTIPYSLEWIFLMEPFGYLIIVVAINFYFFGCAGSGIPLAMDVLDELSVEFVKPEIDNPYAIDDAMHGSHIDLMFGYRITAFVGYRILIGKFILTLAGLAIGASIGIEGPTVQISTCVFYVIAKILFKLMKGVRKRVFDSKEHRLMFVKGIALAGGAAGIAAAFNSPIGGIFFAMEEMGKFFDLDSHKLVFTTVCVSGIVKVAIQGTYTYFGSVKNGFEVITLDYVGVSVFSVVLGGLLGGLWSLFLIWGLRVKKDVRVVRDHKYVVAFVSGILFAVLSYITNGEILLSGYSNVRFALNNDYAYCNTTGIGNTTVTRFDQMSPAFGVAKGAATMLSYWAGIAGGIFAPSIASGAGWGQLFYCGFLRKIFPSISSSDTILLVTQGYFAGATQSPMTAYAILFGCIQAPGNQYALNFTMLTIAISASHVSKLIMEHSLYEAMAKVGTGKVPPECLAGSMVKLRKYQDNIELRRDLQYV